MNYERMGSDMRSSGGVDDIFAINVDSRASVTSPGMQIAGPTFEERNPGVTSGELFDTPSFNWTATKWGAPNPADVRAVSTPGATPDTVYDVVADLSPQQSKEPARTSAVSSLLSSVLAGFGKKKTGTSEPSPKSNTGLILAGIGVAAVVGVVLVSKV